MQGVKLAALVILCGRFVQGLDELIAMGQVSV